METESIDRKGQIYDWILFLFEGKAMHSIIDSQNVRLQLGMEVTMVIVVKSGSQF